jgi:hypothetical protein
MIESFKRLWNGRPLLVILFIALLPRLVATVYSKGYAMHDDHFGPIEQPFIVMHYPQAWTDRGGTYGHSFVYPVLHYALFNGLEVLGVQDPQTTMYVVRFLHALYSLLIVFFGFKIAEVLSDREIAKKVGLILALFWALPFLGVRNLIEVVCIPPLMAGCYYVLISEQRRRNAFVAGLWLGLAFIFRYQTLAFTGTLGLILLFQKRIKDMLLVAGGFLVTALVIQGSMDTFAWGYPFASFIEYVRYNFTHSEDYTTGPWYNYTLLVLGAFIPPISFFLLYGFFKNWKKTLLLLIPLVVFFVLHSSFPNKQERFILPVVPLLLVLSIVGWEEYVRGSAFWRRHQTGLKMLWIWFWIINTLLLVPFSTYYCKKTRVEAMYSLYGKSVTALFQAGGKDGVTEPPFFYGGKYPILMANISDEQQLENAKAQFAVSPVRPNYIFLYGSDNYDQRLSRIENILGLQMTLQQQFHPSFLDYVFYRLNPTHNKNETIYVFKASYQ